MNNLDYSFKIESDFISSYVICEYIWLDKDYNIRSKTKNITIKSILSTDKLTCLEYEELQLLYKNPKEFILKCCSHNIFPIWNFDGSSTGQNIDTNTEIIIKPCNHYKHPSSNYDFIILCDCSNPCLPDFFYFRRNAEKMFEKYQHHHYWFGLEQEYFIMDTSTDKPIGLNSIHSNIKQGPFYCGNDGRYNHGRIIAEKHNRKCLDIGINMSGINAEVAIGQWEYQIGPSGPMKTCDDLIVSRFILNRLAEEYGCYISFEPKILDNWNGSGCHINISSNIMRNKTQQSYETILQAIKNLELNHSKTIENYGLNNQLRMTGIHETSSYDKFTFGIGTRDTSVRIGNDTFKNKHGYFEDRRPGSNINPYLALHALMRDIHEI